MPRSKRITGKSLKKAMIDTVAAHTQHFYNTLRVELGHGKTPQKHSKISTRGNFMLNSLNYEPLGNTAGIMRSHTKRNTTMAWRVGILKRVEYLSLLDKGGTRSPRKKFLSIPIRENLKVKKTNNPPKSKSIRKLIKKKSTAKRSKGAKMYFFKEFSDGKVYFVKKTGSKKKEKLTPLYMMRERTSYNKQFYSFPDIYKRFNKENPITQRFVGFANGTEAKKREAFLARKAIRRKVVKW